MNVLETPAGLMEMPASHSMKCLLGIDLGGTSLRVARVDAQGGELLRMPTPSRAEAETALVSAIRKIVSGWNVEYVGLSRASGLDAQGCVMDWPNKPEWVGLKVVPWLRRAAVSAVDSADDGLCAALWEHRSRADESVGAVTACITIGTGVAVGIMAGDELILTGDGSETLSHQQFGNLDSPCSCGKRGCLQTVLSVRGLKEMLSAGRNATIREAFREFVFRLRDRFNVNLVAITGGGVDHFGRELLVQTLMGTVTVDVPVEISQTPALSSLGGALLLAAGHEPGGVWTGEVKRFIRRQNDHLCRNMTAGLVTTIVGRNEFRSV